MTQLIPGTQFRFVTDDSLSATTWCYYITMRHMFLKLHKLKYVCLLLLFNCLVVPFALKFWACEFFHTRGHLAEEVKRQVAEFTPHILEKLNKRSCTRKENILFLKTHKTGGSTITNILNRYGESRELTFVLPRVGENRLDWPWFFQKNSYFELNGSTPNILCNHARYSYENMRAVMPNDTIFVTILRSPVAQFESSFSYMTLDQILGMKNSSNPIEEFFKDPDGVLVNYVLTQDLRINSDRLKLIRNGMFYDLGLESKDFENTTKIQDMIKQLENQFHLVMLTEYFEESIVLLKRLLCWDLDDMVYFSLKQRTSGWKRNISEPLKEKIEKWSAADVALYNHFNTTFWTILKNLGQDFKDEIAALRARNMEMLELCIRKEHSQSADLFQTAETKQFKIRYDIPHAARQLCSRMTWDEIKYLKHLREIQTQRIAQRYKGSRQEGSMLGSFS